MNMDYSKAFELLSQDAEKEIIKKIEKAVHDNRYNKGFRDGLAVLDKVRAEIIENSIKDYEYHGCGTDELIIETSEVLKIIDNHKAESEDKG